MKKKLSTFPEYWDDYFVYLLRKSRLNKFTQYRSVFYDMHWINFTYQMERDENRAADGISLRNGYSKIDTAPETIQIVFYDRPCSVFEMMIGLAVRVDNEYIGDPSEEHPEFFFMEMFKNLGLDRIDDADSEKTYDVLLTWMNRDFNWDGQGSPFPLTRDLRDQRTLEIWDQMNAYISEHSRRFLNI